MSTADKMRRNTIRGMKSVLAVLSLWVPGLSNIIKRTFGKSSDKNFEMAFTEVVEFQKIRTEKTGHD